MSDWSADDITICRGPSSLRAGALGRLPLAGDELVLDLGANREADEELQRSLPPARIGRIGPTDDGREARWLSESTRRARRGQADSRPAVRRVLTRSSTARPSTDSDHGALFRSLNAKPGGGWSRNAAVSAIWLLRAGPSVSEHVPVRSTSRAGPRRGTTRTSRRRSGGCRRRASSTSTSGSRRRRRRSRPRTSSANSWPRYACGLNSTSCRPLKADCSSPSSRWRPRRTRPR